MSSIHATPVGSPDTRHPTPDTRNANLDATLWALLLTQPQVLFDAVLRMVQGLVFGPILRMVEGLILHMVEGLVQV
jgi:hypothetical protein